MQLVDQRESGLPTGNFDIRSIRWMHGGVRDGAESMQEDDASQHGQYVAGHHQEEESGVTNMKDVGSRISRRKSRW